MKQVLALLVFVTVLTSCNQKIAYVDTGIVINTIDKKVEIETTFKAREEQMNKKADSLSKIFQSEIQEARVKVSKMKSQKDIQAISQEFQIKEQGLKQKFQQEKQALANEYRTEVDSLVSQVKTYISDYGKTNGYEFILGTSDNTVSVAYGKENTNITDVIIEGFNADSNK